MPEFVKRRQPGDPVGALAPHNHLIDRANIANGLTVAYPLTLHRLATGVHLALATKDLLQFIVLTDDIDVGETDRQGAALDYDEGAGHWVDTSDTSGYSPRTLDTIADPHDGAVYLTGERHLCFYEANSQKHIPACHPTLQLATADGDIDIDLVGNAPGTVTLRVIGESGTEAGGPFSLSAYNRTLPRIWDGSPCQVMFHPQSQRWYVISAYSATTMRGTTSGALADTDNSIDVDHLTPLNGYYPISGPSTSITAYNIHSMESDESAEVVVHWNDTYLQWEILQLTCPA